MRTTAASSPSSRPTTSSALGDEGPVAVRPATTASSSPGGILQAQPPPCAYWVSRMRAGAVVTRPNLGAPAGQHDQSRALRLRRSGAPPTGRVAARRPRPDALHGGQQLGPLPRIGFEDLQDLAQGAGTGRGVGAVGLGGEGERDGRGLLRREGDRRQRRGGAGLDAVHGRRVTPPSDNSGEAATRTLVGGGVRVSGGPRGL